MSEATGGQDLAPPVESYDLAATPSAILSMLYFIVFGVFVFKEVYPRIIRWRQTPKYRLRQLGLLCTICIASFVRACYFLLILLAAVQGMQFFAFLYVFWWIPEFCMDIAIISVIYFWCQIYCKMRGNNVFSYVAFRSRLRVIETFYVVLIIITQIFFSIGIHVATYSTQTSWVIIDSLYIGAGAFYLCILPISLGLHIRYFSKPEEAYGDPFFKRISIVMSLWSIGRLARVIDVFTSVPLWSSWQETFSNTTYYWVYISLLYFVMEIIPQCSLLMSGIGGSIEQIENPRNLDELDRKRILALLKIRVNDKLIEDDDAWELWGDKLGEGTYACVHQGSLHHEPVAVKQFTKVLQRDKEALELFCREIEILSTLNHPNVLVLKGVYIDKADKLFVFTELAEQGNLSDVLQSDKIISIDQKIEWASQIALGMVYLHNNFILHRDLKSENILVFANNVCKIGDFGVTKMYDEYDSMALKPRDAVGTEHYMAPEMLRGEQYDYKADVYSYGNIIWELITRQPIQNKKQYYQALKGEPECLFEIMERCASEHPDNRPEFRKIAQILLKYQQSEIKIEEIPQPNSLSVNTYSWIDE